MERKNNGKILNNSYKNGDNLKGEDFEFTSALTVDDVGVSIFMKDTYNFDSIMYTRLVEEVHQLSKSNNRLDELTTFEHFDDKEENRKYTKDELNEVFEIIYNHFSEDSSLKEFLRISYIFDIISNITKTEHRILFDSLNYENTSIVIVDFSLEFDDDITDSTRFIY